MDLDCRACGACCLVLDDSRPDEIVRVLDTDSPLLERVPSARDGRTHLPVLAGRCVYLAGAIGAAVLCGGYDIRPAICRRFPVGGKSCLAVRAQFGIDAKE